MDRLICIFPLLFQNTQFFPGDELPTNDMEYISAWVRNGTAEWKEELEEPKKKKPKARAVTAPAGATGTAIPSTGEELDLVGKVPLPEARGAQPEPTKKGRKRSD